MRTKLLSALALAAALAAACGGKLPSRVDRNWGSAVRDNRAAMIAHPEGSPAEHDPGDPMPGAGVEAAIGRHRAEQQGRQAPITPPSIISIGTVGR